jgi:hypothetical protein
MTTIVPAFLDYNRDFLKPAGLATPFAHGREHYIDLNSD